MHVCVLTDFIFPGGSAVARTAVRWSYPPVKLWFTKERHELVENEFLEPAAFSLSSKVSQPHVECLFLP